MTRKILECEKCVKGAYHCGRSEMCSVFSDEIFVTSRMSKFFFSKLNTREFSYQLSGHRNEFLATQHELTHFTTSSGFRKILNCLREIRAYSCVDSVQCVDLRPDALRNFTIMRRINFGHKKVIKRRFVCKVEFNRIFLRSTLLNFRTHRILFFANFSSSKNSSISHDEIPFICRLRAARLKSR